MEEIQRMVDELIDEMGDDLFEDLAELAEDARGRADGWIEAGEPGSQGHSKAWARTKFRKALEDTQR